jgi:hypothetical protein
MRSRTSLRLHVIRSCNSGENTHCGLAGCGTVQLPTDVSEKHRPYPQARVLRYLMTHFRLDSLSNLKANGKITMDVKRYGSRRTVLVY